MTFKKRSETGRTEGEDRRLATLKARPLLKRWIKERGEQVRCPICGEDDPRTFQKHHVNGDHDDKAKENVVKICASCHNLTYTAKYQLRELWGERHEKWSNLRERARKAWETRKQRKYNLHGV
jgi:phage terminase large subunit GpA-like protein